MTLKHWLKIDHAAFLVALVLSAINLFTEDKTIGMIAFVFLLIAFLYDIYEQKSGKEK